MVPKSFLMGKKPEEFWFSKPYGRLQPAKTPWIGQHRPRSLGSVSPVKGADSNSAAVTPLLKAETETPSIRSVARTRPEGASNRENGYN